MARGWDQGLELFLNDEDLASVSKWSSWVREQLLECVDQIMHYKRELRKAQTPEAEKEAAEILYVEVWHARLERILKPDRLLPPLVEPPVVQSDSPTFSVFPKPSRDPLKVFESGLIINAGEHYQQYALTFLYALTDPNLGPRRIFRCKHEECGKVTIGRAQKESCSDDCRYAYNNAKRPREDKREAVRKYRREADAGKLPKLPPRKK